MILQNFVVLEGIDGAGTTTQLNTIRLRNKNNIYFTAEPTTSETGIFLRKILKGDVKVNPVTAAYLFAADRNEHVNGTLNIQDKTLSTGITSACNNGNIVISDRYFFSSLAYQSIDCGIDIPNKLNSIFPLPELLFYFEIDPEISLNRITGRGYTEIYEKLDFLKKTQKAYNDVIKSYENSQNSTGMRIVRIDATKSKEEISKIIWNEIQNLPIMKK